MSKLQLQNFVPLDNLFIKYTLCLTFSSSMKTNLLNDFVNTKFLEK